MPQHLEQGAAAPTKHEQMAVMRIALELLLYQEGEAVEALAHVGVTGCQPNMHPVRNRDHRRRSSTSITRPNASASKSPSTRMRRPYPSSMRIEPELFGPFASGALSS